MNATQTRGQKMAERRKMFSRLVAEWCRGHWPNKTAEHVAATCGTCVRQAKRMLNGSVSFGLHLPNLIAMGGRSFVRRVIVPFQRACEPPAGERPRGRLSAAVATLARKLRRVEGAGWEGADHAA